FLASVMGRTIWRFLENTLANIPLIRSVYPNIKQVTDFLLAKKNHTENSNKKPHDFARPFNPKIHQKLFGISRRYPKNQLYDRSVNVDAYFVLNKDITLYKYPNC
ncbi:MAG: DUF502 domain-containing protein, partial [Planctomycetes bacterium]|nr:DUF502 domain-containing protein [Planctomycetota bacterium]